MNQREINKLIFKFVVKNVVEHENKLLPYSFILPRINKMNWCSESTARVFIMYMWKKGYITNEMHNGVYKIGLTKKACDQIRQWNAEEVSHEQEQTDDVDGMRLL